MRRADGKCGSPTTCGSYEEVPHLLEELKRDRRWLQGISKNIHAFARDCSQPSRLFPRRHVLRALPALVFVHRPEHGGGF